MDYETALSTLAEVSIAFAGFAGVVAVFGRRSSGQWSAQERNRFVALLSSSFTALLFSVLPFVLLAIPISESMCWRSLSAALVVPRVGFAVALVRIASRALGVPRTEREVSLALSALLLVGGFATIVLLLANVLWLGAVWPYLAAIVWMLAEAGMTFARLVLVPVWRGSAA